MNEPTVFPEWATPGAGVLVVRTKYGTKSVRGGKIARLTKTRIIVTVETDARQYEMHFVPDKFSAGRWSEYGRSSSWDFSATLEPIDSTEAESLMAEQRKSYLVWKARTACNEFTNKPSVEDAKVATDALNAYIEAAK